MPKWAKKLKGVTELLPCVTPFKKAILHLKGAKGVHIFFRDCIRQLLNYLHVYTKQTKGKIGFLIRSLSQSLWKSVILILKTCLYMVGLP